MSDFGVAFNDSDFSDRILRLEIISEEENSSVQVKTFNISSPILAQKSPFFYKLFKNGMIESQQQHFTLKINASEEEALMELLNFMYSNTLTATTTTKLLNVLVIADKFEVTSCMRYCCELLQKVPLSPESALFYLEPSCALMGEAVQPLKDAAKQYLSELYKLQERAMDLPLSGVEVVLSSDDLQVETEDDVVDFVIKWARAHCSEQVEFQTILSKHLVHVIRFPYMSYNKLEEVLVCLDFDHEEVSKLVREALFFKAGLPCGECTHVAKGQPIASSRRFIERAYKCPKIKVVSMLQFPQPWCVVYFDLKKDACESLFPSKRLNSPPFSLGGRCFYLSAQCQKDQQNSSHHFGLFVGLNKRPKTCNIDFEFGVMKKSLKEFQRFPKTYNCNLKNKAMGWWNLFGIPWTDFLAEDSEYFINGILHLRVEVTINA